MNEYKPITGELRERIGQAEHIIPLSGDSKDTQVRINLAWLKEKLDAIDSIHAQLERENAALKAELDRVLGEQEEHAHTRGESITGELREYATNDSLHYCSDYLAIADRIDAEHERQLGVLYRDMSDAEWVRLPKDVDGVPIRVGDALAEGKANPQKAESLMLDYDGWSVNFGLGWCAVKYHKWHHVKPDTWEHIIEDAIGEGMARQRNNDSGNFCERANPMNNGDLVARCKALCERTKEEA